MRVYYEQQPPSAEELSQMDWQTLEQGVATCTKRLEAELSTLKTGDLWDIELDGQDDRSSPIFYGSISNQVAAAVPPIPMRWRRARSRWS